MVLFELDVPGHAAAWAAGNPALVVSCDGGQTLINPVPAGTVPGAPSPGADLYAVLEVCPPGADSHPVRLTLAAPAMCQALAVEYAGRAGSGALPWFHLGGDEVANYVCWDADGPGEEVSPRCTAPRCVALRALCLSPMQYGPGLHRWAARRLPMPLRAPAPKWHVACRPFSPRTASAPCSGRRRCTTASRPRPLWRRGSQVRHNSSGCGHARRQLPPPR